MNMSDFWAKTSPRQSVVTHGIISGRVAQAIINDYLSSGTRALLERATDTDDQRLLALVGYLVSLHDIGKIEYSFQAKDPKTKELLDQDPENARQILLDRVRHERTGERCTKEIWGQAGVNRRLAGLLSKVIGAHHPGRGNTDGFRKESVWFDRQKSFESQMRQFFLQRCSPIPAETGKQEKGILGACLLAALILSDWIASGPAFSDAEDWIDTPDAEDRISSSTKDFLVRSGLCPNAAVWPERFCDLWPMIPPQGRRPLQTETEAIFQKSETPYSLVLLEAPMGEGKTEAGVFAALQMAKQWKKDGFYLALPTAATANQMVGRMRQLLKIHNLEDRVRLLHGMAWLEQTEDYQCGAGEEADGIANWLAPVRRGLLGQYAVGTVDQAMLAATTVKYAALRLLGLSNKVLIIDEIHSYDAYMSAILKRLLEWCKALEIPVVMLSATLPPKKKQDLFSPFTMDTLSQAYPLVTAIQADGTVKEQVVSHTVHSQIVKTELLACLNDPEQIAEKTVSSGKNGGCICVLMNTVKEAQAVYSAIKQRWDGEMMLFHAQFPVKRRAEIEAACVRLCGKDKTYRPKRFILVATQVVEQSLDVDFDMMISAVAPIDLLLQRLGRVHRHGDTPRPACFSQASFKVLIPAEGRSFGSSAYVYPECLLKSSVRILCEVSQIRIPEDIAPMVRDGYDPANASEEDMQKWMEMLIKDQVEAGASQQFLANPPTQQYNPLVEDSFYDDDAQTASAATRLGEPTVRIALLEPDQFRQLQPMLRVKNGEKYAEVWEKQTAEMVMMQSVSVRLSLFQREMSHLSYIKGGKLLSGTRIIQVQNGCCPLENGKKLCVDPELGFLIKEGEL